MYESSEYEEDSLDSHQRTGAQVHCARPSVKDNYFGKSFYKADHRDHAGPSIQTKQTIEEETLSQEFEDILQEEDARKAAEKKVIKDPINVRTSNVNSFYVSEESSSESSASEAKPAAPQPDQDTN